MSFRTSGKLVCRIVNRKMKILLIVSTILMTARCAWCDDVPQAVVDYFAAKNGHAHPDALQIVPVDFKGAGSHQFLMTFAKDNWEGPEAVWAVVELRNGQWTEPKTLDYDGEIKDFSAVNFNPERTSFFYLPSYKHKGLVEYSPKERVWTFTYLNGDVINAVLFWTASQVGLTEDALKKLMAAHKVNVEQVTVQ